MDMVMQIQTLDEIVCILHIANTLGKGMNPTIFPSSYGLMVGQTELFNLIATSLGEGKLWIQTY